MKHCHHWAMPSSEKMYDEDCHRSWKRVKTISKKVFWTPKNSEWSNKLFYFSLTPKNVPVPIIKVFDLEKSQKSKRDPFYK